MNRTPLFEEHVKLGAKMVPFGGFEMPVQYSGIKKEHIAVREAAGIFDVSHMGEVLVEGPAALAFIQQITINNAAVLEPGKAQYSAMCYGNGTIVDDLLVYMLAPERYMLVINAANIEKDLTWMRDNMINDMTLTDISGRTALFAVQGPRSAAILQRFTTVDLSAIPYYRFAQGFFAGVPDMIISATGYTGEKGFELYFDAQHHDAAALWNAILEAGKEEGLIPCGLGARDTLRLEMGFALYGNDISEQTNPLEAGLGWITKLDKGSFNGSEAIAAVKKAGLTRKLVGFVMVDEKAIPRSHYAVCDASGRTIGEVTSGGQSITRGIGIGMAYVETAAAEPGTKIYISIREKLLEANVTKPPFIKK
jgi:aminomethyltransferase